MAGTTVEGTQTCSGAKDSTAVRPVLAIRAAFRMAALGRDTLGVPCARGRIPHRRWRRGERWGEIGTSRRGGAAGEEDDPPTRHTMRRNREACFMRERSV